MKGKLWLSIATLIGAVSAYPIVAWIICFNLYPQRSTLEKQALFFKQFLFEIPVDKNALIALISIALGLISASILGLLTRKYSKSIHAKKKMIICLMLFVIFSITTMMTLFSLL